MIISASRAADFMRALLYAIGHTLHSARAHTRTGQLRMPALLAAGLYFSLPQVEATSPQLRDA